MSGDNLGRAVIALDALARRGVNMHALAICALLVAEAHAGKTFAPTQAPTTRQQRSQEEVQEEPAATAPQAEAASNVPGAHESSRSGDQYDGEYYY